MTRKSQNTVCNLTVDMVDDYIVTRLEELESKFPSLRTDAAINQHFGQIAELHKLRTAITGHRCGMKHIREHIPALLRRQAN